MYVDDLIIAGNDSIVGSRLKQYLGQCFRMKDVGVLKYCLGIEVSHGNQGIFLCQHKNALDIVAKTGLSWGKPSSVPIEQNHRLAMSTEPFMDNPDSYRILVGRLIYLTITRPELSYCVHVLAQFMPNSRTYQWEVALRVVRYLKENPGQGVILCSDSNLRLTAYCNSNLASCPLTRRSLTGYFVMWGNSHVAWKTKK